MRLEAVDAEPARLRGYAGSIVMCLNETTLTLEDDVIAKVRDEARRTGRPLKTIINDAIRRGRTRRDQGSGPRSA